MPQRGDNPNEVLFDSGSKWAYRNVDNYYDADSFIHKPVDEMLSELEEEFDCPLVFLVFRRIEVVPPHVSTYTKPTNRRSMNREAQIALDTEIDRICEFLNHERTYP
jgi:hypothetical protein